MTTGATGQLGLALPVQGELSGTWGDTVNNGITQYTNIAIAGTLTLTGDGAVTLANTTGDASASNITSTLAGAGTVTAQFAIVRVSGTTTTKVVTGPSYSKTYVVDNASSYAVTFKASGQTGVSIAAAEKVTVVFNGTDYIKLAGTIANAAGSNTQIQFNNGGLFGASANLTWDGTTLSSTQVNITGQGTLRLQDTTGGEYVGLRAPASLGASYTLTWPADDGTSGQALITDGSGTLSWSTAASGDVYGPASATDNALARFDGTTGKLIKDSAGLTYDGTILKVSGSANEMLRLDTSSTAYDAAIRIFQAGVQKANIQAGVGTTGGGLDIYSSGSTPIVFGNSSELMRLTSTGLGIGTSSPGGLLQVSTRFRVRSDGVITWGSNVDTPSNTGYLTWDTGVAAIGFNGTGALRFDTSNTERMRLDSAGNLGLGVTPSAWSSSYKAIQNLTSALYGTTSRDMSLGANVFVNSGGNYAYIQSSFATNYTQFNGVHSWSTAPSGTAGDAISFTQAMTLDASGNLGIGQTSPTDKLQIRATQPYLNIQTSSAGTSGSPLWYGIKFNIYDNSLSNASIEAADLQGSVSNGYLRFSTLNSGTLSEKMRLDNAGNLGLGVTPSAWSAYKAMQTTGASFIGYSDGASNNQAMVVANAFYDSGANWKYIYTDNASRYQQFDGQHIWYNAPSGTAGNAISFTQAMTLDASGNLLVGTTSSTLLADSGGFIIYPTGNGETYCAVKHDTGTGSGASYAVFTYATSNIGSITQNGTTGVLYNLTSDYRLKNNPEALTGAKDFVMALQPKKWQWWDGSGEGVGFIAHEFMAVAKYSGTGAKDAVDAEGNPVMQSIQPSSSEVMANLVSLIQEQQAIIESLKARLDAANL